MATRPYDLNVDLVRQFMATAYLTYSNSKVQVAGDGIVSFARGIRYMISITDLCEIYEFDPTATGCTVPAFPSLHAFWWILGTCHWNSVSATQTDIRHPNLRYFMRVLSSTLLCKMEPNKVQM